MALWRASNCFSSHARHSVTALDRFCWCGFSESLALSRSVDHWGIKFVNILWYVLKMTWHFMELESVALSLCCALTGVRAAGFEVAEFWMHKRSSNTELGGILDTFEKKSTMALRFFWTTSNWKTTKRPYISGQGASRNLFFICYLDNHYNNKQTQRLRMRHKRRKSIL